MSLTCLVHVEGKSLVEGAPPCCRRSPALRPSSPTRRFNGHFHCDFRNKRPDVAHATLPPQVSSHLQEGVLYPLHEMGFSWPPYAYFCCLMHTPSYQNPIRREVMHILRHKSPSSHLYHLILLSSPLFGTSPRRHASSSLVCLTSVYSPTAYPNFTS